MKKAILLLSLLAASHLFAQNTFKAAILDSITGMPIAGANVFFKSLKTGGTTDREGRIDLTNIPDGSHALTVSCIGYKTKTVFLSFPAKETNEIRTLLVIPEELQAERVVVTSTRNNGVVADSPVKVEVLGQEEVNEEIGIRPGNITKLLGETSGILVQQTSPVSGNVNFRLQGLPGDYTQLLKDGFPYSGGFSSGLSLLQIPPLDLKQVEVIKGSFSTLYGDGAIAGIVNLVSREPSPDPEWNLIVNRTHTRGTDFDSYYSNTNENIGITFLASQSLQDARDVDGDGFTDIPAFRQTTLNPRLFFSLTPSASLMLGVSSFFEDRRGGDFRALRNGTDSLHRYLEANESKRLNAQIRFCQTFTNGNELTVKNSSFVFDRGIRISDRYFSGRQTYGFSEFTYLTRSTRHVRVFGLNLITDSFQQESPEKTNACNYRYTTVGCFAQDDWAVAPKLSVQTGLRVDADNRFRPFVLPHLSMVYHFLWNLSGRLSGGYGYKIPSPFSAVSERDIVQTLSAFPSDKQAQTSKGVNLDVSYKWIRGEFLVALNQAVYYTGVHDALIPDCFTANRTYPLPGTGRSSLVAKGYDANLIVGIDEFELFADYSYSNVQKSIYRTTSFLELTPRHKLNVTLVLENENNWRTGIEAFYTGRQYLDDHTLSRDFWVFGIMIEKYFKHFSIIGNVENLFDERQTRHERVIVPSPGQPLFRPIYEPLDGMVANATIHFKLR